MIAFGASHVFLAGLLSIVAQVILLRELTAAFYGADLIYLLALGAWLLWTAVGALLARASLEPPLARVAGVLVAIGVIVPLDVALIRGLRLVLGGTPGAYLSLPAQIASSTLCLLLPSVLLGLLFQWAAKHYMSGGRRPAPGTSTASLAKAYAIESVGGMAGGLATTWLLQWRVQNLTLALATAALAFAAAAATGGRHRRSGRPPRSGRSALRIAALAGLLACVIGGWHARRLDLWMTSWNRPDAVQTADTPYGRVTIEKRAGQVAAYENDALLLESEGTEAEDFAHLSMLQHAAPRRVLVVSGIANGVLAPVAEHHPDRIDDVDLNEQLAELLRRHLPASFSASLSLPSVAIAFDDPRHAIRNLDDETVYDVIIVAAAEPASAQANRFFTREFFGQCAARLAPGGLMSLRLASIENLWTRPLVARTASIYAALRQVFADVVVLPGAVNIVLASREPLTRDPEILSGRLAERGIRARLITPRYVRYLYSNDRNAEIRALLQRYPSPPNTDTNAVSYQATSLLWLSKFATSAGRADVAGIAAAFTWSRARAWLLLGVLAAAVVAWRRFGSPLRNAIVAIAAFGGMTLETLLLVYYQLKHGVMFQDLGVLLMSVMAGLAAGAWAVDRRQVLKPRPAGGDVSFGRRVRLLLVAFVLLALACAFVVRAGYGSGLVAVALMLFATGALVAAVFAVASLREDVDQRRLVAPLYAADVFGGAVGSVAASLLMVPLLGMPLTAEWIAALMALAAIAA